MWAYVIGSWAITVANVVFWVLIFRHGTAGRIASEYFKWSLFVTLWSVGYGITLSGLLSYDVTLFWNRLCQVFAAFTGPFFIRYVCAVVHREDLARKIFPAYLILTVGNALGLLFCPLYVQGLWSFGPFKYQPLGGPLYGVFTGVFWAATLHAYWIAWQVCRQARGIERLQLRVFVLGMGITYSGAGTLFLQGFHLPVPSFGVFLILFYVVVTGYLVYRFQFLDVQLTISRALVYSLLITCITATYLLMVLVTERWFQGVVGYRSFLATLVMAFLIAIFFEPVRNRIQALVDRALFSATPAELATQREQLLVEVRKSDQMKAVGTLAAGLAHEIKNPLASIKTFTEALGTNYSDAAFREKFQRIVGGEVERINLIVHQLLEFAKPVPPKLMPLVLPDVIDGTLEFLSNELVQRNIEVRKSYSGRGQILGDPQQLKQVFLNLILNSLQAVNGHGLLTITTEERDGELRIAVTDNGNGINPKDLPHIFEPFYTTKPQGTGLGLAVVQGIIQEHGGRIRFTSRVGQGTQVEVNLPASVTHE